jgi:hypothetical protein
MPDLRRIVFRSLGHWTTGDIPGEAWIATLGLQEKLKRPLDLLRDDDAALLLRTLRTAADKAGGVLRKARRPDQACWEDGLGCGWDSYSIDEGACALSMLEALETGEPPEPTCVDPYHSESAAWNWLWHRFQRSTRDVAAFLLISASWCRQRRSRALHHLDAQQQLPHRLCVDDDDTAIQPWRKFKLPPRARSDDGQLALDFRCMPAQPNRGQLWLL